MKATLEFNLDDQEDAMAHLRCVKATNMAIILWNIEYKFELTEKQREQLLELYKDYGIELNELII